MCRVFIFLSFFIFSVYSTEMKASTRSPESYLFIVDPDVDPSKYITGPNQGSPELLKEKVLVNQENVNSSKNETLEVSKTEISESPKNLTSEAPKSEVSNNGTLEASKNQTSESPKTEIPKERPVYKQNPEPSKKDKKEESSIWPPTGKPKPSEQIQKPQRQAIMPFSLGSLTQGFNLGGLNIGNHSCDRIKLYLSVVQQAGNVETTQLGSHCLVSFKE